MTWKNHCFANGAAALALTGRIDVTLAAIATATLPDQLERVLPLGRHRGVSHWLAIWVVLLWLAPWYLQTVLLGAPARGHGVAGWQHHFYAVSGAVFFGLALGPLLHVVFDGCSHDGVLLGPFTRWKLRLSLYRTRQRTLRPGDVSEWAFLICVVAACAAWWRLRW